MADKLSRNEKKILYNFFEQKSMIDAHSFKFGYLLTKYKTEFDKIDIKNILDSLIKKGYIIERGQKYGIPNVKKFEEIKHIFKFYSCLDESKQILFYKIPQLIWKFIKFVILKILK